MVYFWVNGKIITSESSYYEDIQDLGVFGKFAIDNSCHMPQGKYGIYQFNDNWKHIPFDKFPNEFKIALLLLGVS